MTAVIPIGYVTTLQAAEMLLPAIYAGTPDTPMVARLREEGMDVADGPAKDRAITKLWKAVDLGALTPMAVGGRRSDVVKLDPALTKVPMLRNPRVRGFTFLRPSNPAFHELAAHFGQNFSNVSVVFSESEIQKLARKLIRARRVQLKVSGSKTPGPPIPAGNCFFGHPRNRRGGEILALEWIEGADAVGEQKGEIRAAGER